MQPYEPVIDPMRTVPQQAWGLRIHENTHFDAISTSFRLLWPLQSAIYRLVADKKIEIRFPSQPFEIGKTIVDGNPQPVWVDPHDFIRTGDQNDELVDNIRKAKIEGQIEQAVNDLTASVEAWLARVMQGIMPPEVYTGSAEAKAAWLKERNIYTEEHLAGPGLRKILLKHGSEVVSEFRCKLKGGMESFAESKN